MPRLQIAIAFALLLLPVTAAAAWTETWDFRSGRVPGSWEVTALTPTPTAEGLRIQSTAKGHMTREVDFAQPIETIVITYTNQIQTQAILMWHPLHLPDNQLIQLPMVLEQTDVPKRLELDVSSLPDWEPQTDKLGLMFPPGVQLTLQEMRFLHHSPWEKFLALVQGFWTFDNYRAYTVNFLWGPRLPTTPAEIDYLFQRLPPLAPSANWLFYGILAAAVIFAALQVRRGRWDFRKGGVLVLTVCGSIWLLYDIRMGSEVVSYAYDDYQSYWSQTGADRMFRDRGRFNAFAEQISDTLRKEESYVLLLGLENPYRSLMRYSTLPARPLTLEEATEDVRYWAVIDAPGLSLEEDRLVRDGEPISPPGEVVDIFAPGMFLFRTNP